MNIKVDRSLFLNELHYLQGVAGTKQIIPVLSHLLIETGAGRIAMRATDFDLMITTDRVDFSCDSYGALIPASVSEFDALVKKEKMMAAGSKRRRKRESRPQD